MCKVGDIILVKNYSSHGVDLSQHSFIIISKKKGKIEGLDYNMICNVMSSFHSEEHKKHKLSYPGNIEVHPSDEYIEGNRNGLGGYVKAEQLYFFDETKLDYTVIGNITDEFMKLIKKFIEAHPEMLEIITDNIKR